MESLIEAAFTRGRARPRVNLDFDKLACCRGSPRTCATWTGGATSLLRAASTKWAGWWAGGSGRTVARPVDGLFPRIASFAALEAAA